MYYTQCRLRGTRQTGGTSHLKWPPENCITFKSAFLREKTNSVKHRALEIFIAASIAHCALCDLFHGLPASRLPMIPAKSGLICSTESAQNGDVHAFPRRFSTSCIRSFRSLKPLLAVFSSTETGYSSAIFQGECLQYAI